MKRDNKKHNALILTALLFGILGSSILSGCGSAEDKRESGQTPDLTETAQDIQNIDKDTVEADIGNPKENAESVEPGAGASGIARESAQDAQIDFAALKQENPDIFAWLYLPGTQIDCPVLQSEEADDFYEKHNASGEADTEGAVYIELANLNNMCDFNTVLHGKAQPDGSGLFADLYHFADPDFFEGHEQVYLYLDGNVLTYEVFAAYERENTSLIRSYDFTYISGCQQFLNDLYGAREMNKNMREGWDDLTPYHFLITLTAQKEESPDKQFIVVAALIDDAAGTIDRVVME